MRSGLLTLFALPTAWAALAYTPPTALQAAAADATSDCKLPNDYHIKSFKAESANPGNNSLSSFEFAFYDDTTDVSTPCYFNSSSEATESSGKNPRYPCQDSRIDFIWQNEVQKLWMFQKVCPGSDGAADFEVSGSVVVPVQCASKCTANSTDYTSVFTSVQPVRE